MGDPLAGLRFCIISEQAYARNTIRQIFQSVGIWSLAEHRTFKGGQNLLESAERPFDAVIIESSGDEAGARTFVQAVRGHENAALSRTPIIMATAAADMDEIEDIRDLGVNAILLRPFSAKGLMLRVRKALDRKIQFIRDETYTGPCRRVRPVGAGAGFPERRAA